jgi:hypothetical protein
MSAIHHYEVQGIPLRLLTASEIAIRFVVVAGHSPRDQLIDVMALLLYRFFMPTITMTGQTFTATV